MLERYGWEGIRIKEDVEVQNGGDDSMHMDDNETRRPIYIHIERKNGPSYQSTLSSRFPLPSSNAFMVLLCIICTKMCKSKYINESVVIQQCDEQDREENTAETKKKNKNIKIKGSGDW